MPYNPTEIADALIAGVDRSAAKARRKALSVSISPGVSAARNIDGYRSGVMAALDSGKTKRAMESVSLADWQKMYLEKGVPNMGSGVRLAKQKIVSYWNVFGPALDSINAQVDSMPRGRGENNKQRMLRNFELLSKFSYDRTGSAG